jgi:hypothetical protein
MDLIKSQVIAAESIAVPAISTLVAISVAYAVIGSKAESDILDISKAEHVKNTKIRFNLVFIKNTSLRENLFCDTLNKKGAYKVVEIKVIQYYDGIIIECVDEKNARAVVPKSYISKMNKKTWIPPYQKSPLTVIMQRLEKDFNYKNLGKYSYVHFENEKTLYYNFHRKIIE